MNVYRVHKEVRTVAKIIGLKPLPFTIFLVVSLLIFMLFISSTSMEMLIFVVVVIVGGYYLALTYQDKTESATGVPLPKKLQNR